MDDKARNFVELAQIELAYAELELLQLGFQMPELRRSVAHIASAKKILRQLTADADWTEDARSGARLAAAPEETPSDCRDSGAKRSKT